MAIELIWLIPHKILLAIGANPITEEDVVVFVEELSIILDAADRPIHTVLDMSAIKTLDDSAAYIFYDSPIPMHPNRGRFGIVNANFQSRVQADILNRISGVEIFQFFNSREAASAFLQAHDSPPPMLPAGYNESRPDDNPDTMAPDEAETC